MNSEKIKSRMFKAVLRRSTGMENSLTGFKSWPGPPFSKQGKVSGCGSDILQRLGDLLRTDGCLLFTEESAGLISSTRIPSPKPRGSCCNMSEPLDVGAK